MSERICDNCRHYRKLSPGAAGICFFKWRGLRWNEAAPLMPADGTCDAFSPKLEVSYDDEVTAEQIAAVDALVAKEFEDGDWVSDVVGGAKTP